jgi:hypothetical protein
LLASNEVAMRIGAALRDDFGDGEAQQRQVADGASGIAHIRRRLSVAKAGVSTSRGRSYRKSSVTRFARAWSINTMARQKERRSRSRAGSRLALDATRYGFGQSKHKVASDKLSAD